MAVRPLDLMSPSVMERSSTPVLADGKGGAWRTADFGQPYLGGRGLDRAGTAVDPRPEASYACIAYVAYMTEVTVSARIPKDMEEEVEQLMREEHLERSAAIRTLLHLGLERYRRERALRLLAEGKATLSRGAEVARMSVWEFADLVRERKIAWVADDVLEDLKDLRGT